MADLFCGGYPPYGCFAVVVEPLCGDILAGSGLSESDRHLCVRVVARSIQVNLYG